MKKALIFIGSPRKGGNTDTVVKEIMRGIDQSKIEVEVHYLDKMNIKGCKGCLYCRNNPGCALKDDMVDIYESLKLAEYVVIASPVYICQVSAQTKLLLDRLYPLTEINKWKHIPRFGKKKLIMVYTHAAPFDWIFKKYFKYTAKSLKGLGLIPFKTLVSSKAFNKDSTKNNERVLRKAYKIGQLIQ
nr:flavodoxin family protein [uncultured Niameybacter sp.]